ncbi:hypothetical protein [Archaeoglobus neptunius]|uniref:hypothetical protein n=1 Tax=Archaeoglobus neptunius TaxID=2798580 RepID=UPI0019294F22|nr:hypothetical protein [Archaeoglobus neptunius]
MMRVLIAVIIIVAIGLLSYHIVALHLNSNPRKVYVDGDRLILAGIDNPEVHLFGCGKTQTFHSSIIKLEMNCSDLEVNVYSYGRLVFSGSFHLNP